MKLMTHNMLTSKCLKGVTTGYPLTISAKEVTVTKAVFYAPFMQRIVPKLDYDVVWKAAQEIGHAGDLPKSIPEDYENNMDFLKKIHHVLFEIEVVSGELLCPESGRAFPINNGVPNMLINEDEV